MFRLWYVTPLALTLLAAPGASAQATKCKDGTTSAVSGRGACTGHGGVDKAATKVEKKEAKVDRKEAKAAQKEVKAEQKAAVKEARAEGAKVTCTDGTMSEPGRGACSRHGGVRVAAATMPTRASQRPAAVPPAAPPAREKAGASPRAAAAAASGRGEDNDPKGAIAKCNDGMYSHAANRQGACARHKGVAKWM